jgi:hypothetical protein
MTYTDGSEVRAGDLIWWDEGHCVGYVQSIIESREDFGRWGLNAPGIFVSNRHPFDGREVSGVNYDADSFADEGIGLLSVTERQEFERAKRLALAGRKFSWFSATTLVEAGTLKAWMFTLHDESDRKTVVPILYEHPTA